MSGVMPAILAHAAHLPPAPSALILFATHLTHSALFYRRREARYVLFYEYFHGDNGAGLGASHQTGWTALVAKLIQQSGGSSD